MRQKKLGSDEDFEEDTLAEGSKAEPAPHTEVPEASPVNRGKNQKRKNNGSQEESVLDQEQNASLSKRRRRTTASTEDRNRTLRRQSTMTQLADGRRPSIGAEEPNFKSTKRRSRPSLGRSSTENERDKKQRTLTQMIPGMGRLSKEELDELSDLDADLEEDQTNSHALPRSLMDQGLLEVDSDSHEIAIVSLSGDKDNYIANTEEEGGHDSPVDPREQPSVVVRSVEDVTEDDEDDYQPTQFIEAPSRRSRQTPRRIAPRQHANQAFESRPPAKSRFSLLSTPEKRRIFEIPSSQSPAESVLSTQTSPPKSRGSVLRERTSNVKAVAETPSKRRQVTFQELDVQPAPPALLRKFESTIQDSEDEDGSDIEDDSALHGIVGDTDQVVHGQAVGADTQAVLDQINQACAGAYDRSPPDGQDSSEEHKRFSVRRGAYVPSPELGESWAPVIYDDDGPSYESYRSTRLEAESQSSRDVEAAKEKLPTLDRVNEAHQNNPAKDTDQPLPSDDLPSTPPVVQSQLEGDLPSTPMIIRDESSDDEEAESEPQPPRTTHRIVPQPSLTLVHQSTDLDGEPVQVPRSPSVDRETQQSHSSKAEQQLQSEWLSCSQYAHARRPNSSSMRAAADAFSYNATPGLPKSGALAASSARIQYSQATTVDEVTPKKNRTQRVVSADITPHRVSKSQPFVSPEKPPSLFIPSSFPSPSRAAMEGWSSPPMARTQNVYGSSQILGSLEDFSIPLPPPIEDD